MNTRSVSTSLLALATALSLGACNTYVKRTEFDTTVQELRTADQRLQSQIDTQMRVLRDELDVRFKDYDARITAMGGRLRVDMTAHFAFDDATLRDQDRPALDDFARVIREHHPDVLVTVEGFTDPAGNAGYNQRLGQQRAEAVRNYLLSQGLREDQLRAVSYGEADNRQVVPGAAGDDGLPNRRVALVVDFAGHG